MTWQPWPPPSFASCDIAFIPFSLREQYPPSPSWSINPQNPHGGNCVQSIGFCCGLRVKPSTLVNLLLYACGSGWSLYIFAIQSRTSFERVMSAQAISAFNCSIDVAPTRVDV